MKFKLIFAFFLLVCVFVAFSQPLPIQHNPFATASNRADSVSHAGEIYNLGGTTITNAVYADLPYLKNGTGILLNQTSGGTGTTNTLSVDTNLTGKFSGNGGGLTNLNLFNATNYPGKIVPQQYGVYPDNTTDCTAAFNQAINDSFSSGKEFLIVPPTDPSFHYVIAGTLYDTNAFGCSKIDGGSSGTLVFNNVTILKSHIWYTGTGIFMVISNSAEKDGLKVHDLQVYCPNKASCGFWQDSAPGTADNNFSFNNVYLYNCKTNYCFNAIGNSRFVDCRWAGSYGWNIGLNTGAANFSLSFDHCDGGGIPGTAPLTNSFTINSGLLSMSDMDINTSDFGQSGMILNGSPQIMFENVNFESSSTNYSACITATNTSSGVVMKFSGGKAQSGNDARRGPFIEVGTNGATLLFDAGSYFSGANAAGVQILSHVNATGASLLANSRLTYDLVVSNTFNAVTYNVPHNSGQVLDISSFTPARWNTCWNYLHGSPNDEYNVGFRTNGVDTSADLLAYSKDNFAGKVANPLNVNTWAQQQKFSLGLYLNLINGYNTGAKMYSGSGMAVEFGAGQLSNNEWYIGHSAAGTSIDTFDIYDDVAAGKITVTPNTTFTGTVTANATSILATNRLAFTTVSSFTNTLGRDANAILSAGTSIILQDTNGNNIATLGTIATLDIVVPMHVNMRISGTGVSAILY